jgi:hypothetical protein
MLDLFNEITYKQVDMVKSFAAFLMIIFSARLGDSMINCEQMMFLKKKSKLFNIIACFFLFYFLVTIFSNTGNFEHISPIVKFMYSIIYFSVFLIVMRLDMRISFIVFILIFTIYFIELNKDFYLDPKNKKYTNTHLISIDWPFKIQMIPINHEFFTTLNKIENLLFYVILMLLILGFIAYGGEIKDTLKSSRLTWVDVIVDTNFCKIRDRKSFLHYLTLGLGLKL